MLDQQFLKFSLPFLFNLTATKPTIQKTISYQTTQDILKHASNYRVPTAFQNSNSPSSLRNFPVHCVQKLDVY